VSVILAIDTASADFALALARDGAIVRTVVVPTGHDHSRLLLRAIDELLGGDREALQAIVVVRGPGSYAGIRVGIATAQGLALALGIPVHGVSTLEAVARASGLPDVTAIHPAGRGEFAVQAFHGSVAVGELQVLSAIELRGENLAGEGAAAFGGAEIDPGARCHAALELGLESLAAGGPTAPGSEALYLREPNITLPRKARVTARPS
jgi:tRNA threonylcarbamoyl adenosine modification protein YeaZ